MRSNALPAALPGFLSFSLFLITFVCSLLQPPRTVNQLPVRYWTDPPLCVLRQTCGAHPRRLPLSEIRFAREM